MKDKNAANKMFLMMTTNEPENHVSVFTEGSVHEESNTTTCAFYIPKLEEKQSWMLSKHTSIFSAELTAIVEALKFLYTASECDEASIFTDSKASLLAIQNRKLDSSPL